MPSNTDLFDLIKSMTKMEKRHFKVNAKKHSGSDKNKYIKLFDAIDNMTTYDEETLKNKFKNESFVKQLYVYKNYLRRIILRSLASYHAQDSIYAQIQELLRQVEVLYNKGLINQCTNLLTKTEKLCRAYQKHPQLLQVLDWKQKIFLRHYQLSHLIATIEDERAQLQAIDVLLQYKTKAHRIYEKVVQAGYVLPDEDKRFLEEMINDPVMNQEPAPDQVDTLYYKYSCLSLYAMIHEDLASHYHYNYLIVQTLENNPQHIEENPNFYVSALNNLCNAQMGMAKWEELETTINKLRTIPETYRTNQQERVRKEAVPLSYDIELNYLLYSGKIDRLPQVIENVAYYVSQYPNNIKKHNYLDICFNMANALFILAQYERALDWLNQILIEHQLNIREDIYSMSKVLNLMIHYELGNELLLPSIIKSTYRFLKKREKLHNVEEAFLSFLKKQEKTNTKGEFRNLLNDLRQELLGSADDSPEANNYRYFNFIDWIDSKLADKPMADIMREKTT